MWKLKLPITLWLLCGLTIEALASNCSQERDLQFDKCAGQVAFLGDRSFKVPQQMAQMNQFCSDLKVSLTCMQSYSRECLVSLARQVVNGVIKNGKQLHTRLCHSDAPKQEFQRNMACLVGKTDELQLVMEGSVSRFEYIASPLVGQQDKLVAICCSGQLFRQTLHRTMTSICPASTNYVTHLAGDPLDDLTQLVCQNYQSMEECQAARRVTSILAQMQNITTSVQKHKLTPKGKSLIPILVAILDEASASGNNNNRARP